MPSDVDQVNGPDQRSSERSLCPEKPPDRSNLMKAWAHPLPWAPCTFNAVPSASADATINRTCLAMATVKPAAWKETAAPGASLGSNLRWKGVDVLSQYVILRDDEIDGPTFCLCIVRKR